MNDLFKRTLVVCSAAGIFGSGAFVAGTWIDGALTSKIKSVQASEPSVVEQVVETVNNVVNKRR